MQLRDLTLADPLDGAYRQSQGALWRNSPRPRPVLVPPSSGFKGLDHGLRSPLRTHAADLQRLHREEQSLARFAQVKPEHWRRCQALSRVCKTYSLVMSLPFHYLLIDDNPHDQLLAQEAFHHLCPECVLSCASSGKEALELLTAQRFEPDVVLLDINMPGMSGFEVLEALKKDVRLRRIPVVMLSTSSSRGDVDKAYTLHASSYLLKSSSFEEFLKQIDNFLNYWRSAQLAHKEPVEE
ncbi:response regulator [Deinococcus oregonensis]|uniref:Response regulator n=1 Tax=Deinococcus oregonensis TaxID=1805970 RepID=A0ABV6B0S3_9DEIO